MKASEEDSGAGDNVSKAEELKSQANQYFKTENYPKAIEFYTQCIQLNPNNAVYYENRSIVHLRSGNFELALEDATKAIETDKSRTKAYYRRAAAYESLEKYKLALKDCKEAEKMKPNDEDIHLKYAECKKKYISSISFKTIVQPEHMQGMLDKILDQRIDVKRPGSSPLNVQLGK